MQLPFETGNSVADTEEDKLFISTKRTLLELSKSQQITQVLLGFSTLLDTITKVSTSCYCEYLTNNYLKLIVGIRTYA